MKSELKACPFCGDIEHIAVHNQSKNNYVECLCCGARGPKIALKDCYIGKEKAVAAWNRRSALENKPLTINELRQIGGEPVWVVMIGEAKPPICEIVVGSYNNGIKMTNAECSDDYGAFDLYGKTWLAYRHKPEED